MIICLILNQIAWLKLNGNNLLKDYTKYGIIFLSGDYYDY